jgi:hypothetical protein
MTASLETSDEGVYMKVMTSVRDGRTARIIRHIGQRTIKKGIIEKCDRRNCMAGVNRGACAAIVTN